jgi:hypothetical protein
MDLTTLKATLLWASAIHYGVLLLWLGLLSVGKEFFYGLQSRFFPMERADLVRCNYLMYGLYKLAILVFNVIPWIALQLV